jgi:hypothetical protein
MTHYLVCLTDWMILKTLVYPLPFIPNPPVHHRKAPFRYNLQRLFPDTKATEYIIQYIVCAHRTCNLAEVIQGLANVHSEQVAGNARHQRIQAVLERDGCLR